MDIVEILYVGIKLKSAINTLAAMESVELKTSSSDLFSVSSCKMSDKLIELYETLQEIELTLNEVINKTKGAMEFAGISFETTDNNWANIISMIKP